MWPPLDATFRLTISKLFDLRLSKGNQVFLYARRHIKVGEEISDCYGFHYTSLERDLRRQRLEKWFSFRCSCVACGLSYPTMSTLTSNLAQKTHDQLKTLLEKFQWALKNGEVKFLQGVPINKWSSFLISVI